MGLSLKLKTLTLLFHITIQKRSNETILQRNVQVAISDETNYQFRSKKESKSHLPPLCQDLSQRLPGPKSKVLKMRFEIPYLDSVIFC